MNMQMRANGYTSTLGGGLASAGSAPTAAPTEDVALDKALSNIDARLAAGVERLFALTGRAEVLADRAFGPIPEPSEKTGVAPPPCGAVGELNARMDEFAYQLGRLQTAVQRLEKLV